MSDETWVLLKEYGSRLEADLDIGTLETARLPLLVRGPEAGIFGPGFAGSTHLGVRLFVPRDLLAHARELIGVDDQEQGEGNEAIGG